jgi:tetratricopeptide (TPR) repeat protein
VPSATLDAGDVHADGRAPVAGLIGAAGIVPTKSVGRGDRRGWVRGLCSRGEVSVRRSEYSQAIDYLRQALAVFRQAGDQHGETLTQRTPAEALDAAGQHDAARAELTAALQQAAEAGNTYQQASAHRDLGESHHSNGEKEQAHQHWQQALTLYTRLGAPIGHAL